MAYETIMQRIRAGKRFFVASHSSPDGDGIGSTLAMGLLLTRMGKEVVLYNRDGVPKNLAFLPGGEAIVRTISAHDRFDLAIMVDCGQRKRISDEFAAFTGFDAVACIDHHLLERTEADDMLLDPSAASTGEVVFKLIQHAGSPIDAAIAQCIYTTLVVDTGFFKYSNTHAEVLGLAAQLVAAGASPWVVAKNLEESHPISRMRLLGLSLKSLEYSLEGRYASMDVTQQMLAEAGATIDLSDEFAVFPRSVEGVEVSALFRELDDGRVKASLRSKEVIDVAALARSFGGGGHARAAGLQIKAELSEAKKLVFAAVQKAFESCS